MAGLYCLALLPLSHPTTPRYTWYLGGFPRLLAVAVRDHGGREAFASPAPLPPPPHHDLFVFVLSLPCSAHAGGRQRSWRRRRVRHGHAAAPRPHGSLGGAACPARSSQHRGCARGASGGGRQSRQATGAPKTPGASGPSPQARQGTGGGPIGGTPPALAHGRRAVPGPSHGCLARCSRHRGPSGVSPCLACRGGCLESLACPARGRGSRRSRPQCRCHNRWLPHRPKRHQPRR
jgi:hypothetical protein